MRRVYPPSEGLKMAFSVCTVGWDDTPKGPALLRKMWPTSTRIRKGTGSWIYSEEIFSRSFQVWKSISACFQIQPVAKPCEHVGFIGQVPPCWPGSPFAPPPSPSPLHSPPRAMLIPMQDARLQTYNEAVLLLGKTLLSGGGGGQEMAVKCSRPGSDKDKGGRARNELHSRSWLKRK